MDIKNILDSEKKELVQDAMMDPLAQQLEVEHAHGMEESLNGSMIISDTLVVELVNINLYNQESKKVKTK